MTHLLAHHSNSPLATTPGQQAAAKRHKELTTQAQKWVAQTFYGTLLKQMRQSPFKSDLVDGGRGGEMFSELLDQHLAGDMSRSTGSKLVNSLVRQIEGTSVYSKQAKSIMKAEQTTSAAMYQARLGDGAGAVSFNGKG